MDTKGIGWRDHFVPHKYIKNYVHMEQLPQNNL